MKEIFDEIKSESKLIKSEEFDAFFDTVFERTQKTIKKFEVEQCYNCDLGTSYYNYINHNYNSLIENFSSFSKDWPSWLNERPSLKFERLHLIYKPITQYIMYEMYFYLINEKAGEKIRCLDFGDSEIKYGEVSDFIIFDDNELVINFHDCGEYLMSYYCSDKTKIKKLSKEFKKLYLKATDYKNVAKFNKDLIQKMKMQNLI